MVVDVLVPKLGVEMTHVRILEWHTEETGWVRRGDVLLTVETEKVTYELKAEAEGFLHIVAAVDEETPVGAVLARLAATREEYAELSASAPVAPAAREPARSAGAVAPVATAAVASPSGEVRATPLARNVARQHGIDITTVTGSGIAGRIREADVRRVVETWRQQAGNGVKGAREPSARREARRTPFKGLRRVIARNLHDGLRTMAQMTDLGEIDVTEVVRLRAQLNREPRLVGVDVSYTDLLVKAVALVLRELPRFNASLDGDDIVEWADVNVAVAVSVEGGLHVPVVARADEKSVKAIDGELRRLIERARRGELALEDVTGATFTLTNFGSYGSYMGTPLINPPQVAILGTGQILEKPVVQAGQVVVRWMMGYGFTIDHRVLDGADAGRFIARLRELCERPAALLVP
jgi:pyruvate dehydrogenase E2 component (dihydrolipoyllysine-residue acetyltransferase)